MSKTCVAPDLKSFESYFDGLLVEANGYHVLEKVEQEKNQVYWNVYVEDKYSLLVSVTKYNSEIYLKISLAMYEIKEQEHLVKDLYTDLLSLNEEIFFAGAKVGLQGNLIVLGFHFLLTPEDFGKVKAVFGNLVSSAEEHLKEIANNYQLEPLLIFYRMF